jgi:hypothetical protein
MSTEIAGAERQCPTVAEAVAFAPNGESLTAIAETEGHTTFLLALTSCLKIHYELSYYYTHLHNNVHLKNLHLKVLN